jgi:hypothetical protein
LNYTLDAYLLASARMSSIPFFLATPSRLLDIKSEQRQPPPPKDSITE